MQHAGPALGKGCRFSDHFLSIGVLFRLLCSKIDGTGLDESYSIYQGRLFVQETIYVPEFLDSKHFSVGPF